MSDDARVWTPLESVPNINNYSSVVSQRFVALASQQLFTLTKFAYSPSTNSILVYKNGVLLVPDYDFTETDEAHFTTTVACTAGDIVLAVGFLGYQQAVVDPYYLGPKASAPTVDNLGVTLSPTHEGYTYWNTTTDDYWVWTGVLWQLLLTSVATSANLVSVSDIAGNFTGTNVETVLAEIISTYAATTTGKGASKIGIEDSASSITATTVEVALAELSLRSKIGTLTASAGGTVNAITATLSPVIALVDGTEVAIIAAGANTSTTVTFNPNAAGPKNIKKSGNQPLVIGDIFGAGHVLKLKYSSANDVWELLNPAKVNLDLFVKGADVTSAATLPVGSDGNYFDVTGTTGPVTAIQAVKAGTLTRYHFDDIVTFTNHATDLILGQPGAADLTTIAGDELTFFEYEAGKHRLLTYRRFGGIIYADLSLANSIKISDLDIANSEGIYQWESGNWNGTTAYQVDGSVDGTSWVEYERRRIYIPANANSIHGQCNHHRHPSFAWNAEARLTISGVGSSSAVATSSATYEINSIPALSVSALEGWYTLVLEHRTVQVTAEGRSYMDGFAAKLI